MNDFIKKRTPSDAQPVLRWAVLLLTALSTALIIWAATGKSFADELLLPNVVVAYGTAMFSYSFLSTLLYRKRKREEQEEKNKKGKRHSYGELVGTGFVATLFLIGLLVGFRVWNFKLMPDAAFQVIDITVGIIAAASIAKNIALPKIARTRHNAVLYFLSVYTTAVIILLLARNAFGGPQLIDDYLWSYGIILISYVTHNVIFSILKPGVPQKRHGHVVALAVVLFTIAMYILNALGVSDLPRFITPFFSITVLVLGFGAGAKFMLREPLWKFIFGTVDERIIREHLENEHASDDMDDCNDCSHDNKEL